MDRNILILVFLVMGLISVTLIAIFAAEDVLSMIIGFFMGLFGTLAGRSASQARNGSGGGGSDEN